MNSYLVRIGRLGGKTMSSVSLVITSRFVKNVVSMFSTGILGAAEAKRVTPLSTRKIFKSYWTWWESFKSPLRDPQVPPKQ
ncbi:hypothetical protein VNO77_00831 [Canavalia gladiata]|uniref:Uncharacterized protein n=1 Tax=Canavalia gladiata TaxID=3824 RepID=A0AAN9MQT0_CANGL